jgi:hypothetical protein
MLALASAMNQPCSALLAVAAISISGSASAFDGPWHAGIGGGVVAPSTGYRAGPALTLHAAYGLSDVFDARLNVTSSLHELGADHSRSATLSSGSLGLAYKVDVIEWVPYLGVRAGYFRFGGDLALPYARGGGLIGGMAGCDYSFNRDFAAGVEVGYDLLLPEGRTLSALLRAEYRWGY